MMGGLIEDRDSECGRRERLSDRYGRGIVA
jgi:hypothetical protein